MGLFGSSRRARTARKRLVRRMVALGTAGAALITGAGLAAAATWEGTPGYKTVNRSSAGHVDDLGVLGYKDGHPFYCLHMDSLYRGGDENTGAWSTNTGIDYRIAARMVKEHEADRTDLTQASVAYAIHDHLDSDRAAFLRIVGGGLQGGDLNRVRATASSFWDQAKSRTPASMRTRVVAGDLSRGTATAEIRTQDGRYAAGVPWRIVMLDGAGTVRWDGPTSGTTTNGPIHIRYHARKKGAVKYQIQYSSAVARRMEASSGGRQPLFTTIHEERWFPSGVQFEEVSPTYTLGVTTRRKSGDARVGGNTPVRDSLTVRVSRSSSDTTLEPIRDKATVILHFDGTDDVPAAQASKQMTVTGAGTVDSPSFTPADLGWTSPAHRGWQAGTYWFDVRVPRQGQMGAAVDTPDWEPSETFRLKESVPPPARKRIEEGHVASAMPDRTVISSGTGRGGYHMTFADTFTNPGGLSYKVTDMKVTDATDKKDVSGQFTFSNGEDSPAKVTAAYKGTDELPLDHTFEFGLTVTVTRPREGNRLTDKATVLWNNDSGGTDEHHFDTHEPKPDKAWVLDRKGALTTDDPGWTNKVGADGKTFLPGDPVSAVANGRVPADLVHDLASYGITDDWGDAAKYVDFSDASKAAVYYDGRDVTNQFDIKNDGTRTVATAKAAFLKGTARLKKDKTVKLVISGTFRTDYTTAGRTEKLTNSASEQWNDHKKPTNIPAVFTWTPIPDKAWIRNTKSDGTGAWQAVIDPTKSNKTGGDEHKFLDGDPAGAAVNGTIPTGLAVKPTIALSDDYGKADYVWDPSDKATWKVYEADVDDYSKSTVSDIINHGRDVTSQFTLAQKGTTITARASDAYEQGLVGLKKGRQIVLLVPGCINLADGGGNRQVYKDTGYSKNNSKALRPGADQKDVNGYQVCSNPAARTGVSKGEKFLNKGSEKAGGVSVPTNEPSICTWVNNPDKGIVAEAQYGGDQHDGDGQDVRPGQNIEYRLHVLDRVPDKAGYAVDKVVVTDHYDPHVSVDGQTLKIVDNASHGYTVPKTSYDQAIDTKNRTITLTFHADYISQTWETGRDVDLDIVFEGRVDSNLPKDACTIVNNHFILTINNGDSVSNTVSNKYCPPDTKKDVTQKDKPSITVNGKTALLGDKLDYRLKLSAKDLKYDEQDPEQGKQLYRVQRLGMSDDYDEQYLRLDAKDIRVLDENGRDVTAKFNTSVEDGVAYIFAKTVDGKNPVTGAKVSGDPQPTSLKEYSERKLDRLSDPYIDQNLLGQDYTIVLPVTVIKVTDGYDVKNTGIQIVDDQEYVTNTVHNPLKEINPRKDVVVNVGDASVNGKDIYLHHYFLYRLQSSKRPTGLAYPEVTDWRIVDRLDPAYDRYTGQWAVYADADLFATDGQKIASEGEKIAGSSFDSSKLRQGGILTGNDTQLFTVAQTTDGTVTVAATDSYKRLVSDGAHEAAWSAYIQVQRMKTTSRHENTLTEYINGTPRHTPPVWTRTPDQTPSMRIEKYDLKSGLKLGDRNKTSEALDPASDGTRIGLLITNTGKSDLHRFEMVDKTIAGAGDVTWDQKDLDALKSLTLKPGESFTVHGTLDGVKDVHTDRAQVTSTPVLPCPTGDTPDIDQPQDGTTVKYCDSTPIKESDDWNGKRTALADTGTSVLIFLPAALGVLGFGTILIVPGRRHGQHSQHPRHRR